MYYELVKISSPGYTLCSSHPEHIRDMLEREVCSLCKVIEDEEKEVLKRIDQLLSTPCGAEFLVDTYQSYAEYVKSNVEMTTEQALEELENLRNLV